MFRYKAIKTKANDESSWYSFDLKDCPVLSSQYTFFLANKKGTPIMYYNTIVRGHPDIDMYEGDIVYDKESDEEIGVVVYSNGFMIAKNTGGLEKIKDLGHIYLKDGDKDSIHIANSKNRTPIEFCYDGVIFDITDFVMISDDILYLIHNKRPRVAIASMVRELLFYEGKSNSKWFDGDFYHGRFLSVENVLSM